MRTSDGAFEGISKNSQESETIRKPRKVSGIAKKASKNIEEFEGVRENWREIGRFGKNLKESQGTSENLEEFKNWTNLEQYTGI